MDATTGEIIKTSLKGDWKSGLGFAINVFVLVIVAFLVFYIGKKLLKNAIGDVTGAVEGNENIDAVEARTGTKANYTDAEYKQMASGLEACMIGAGTDEEGVKAIMQKIKNDSDMARLIDAFGTRTGRFSWTATDLTEWIYDDFSDSDDRDLYVNKPLRDNGVTFQF